MAKIVFNANIDLKLTIQINEAEARALVGLSGYDMDSFLKIFEEFLGKHYIKDHHEGLKQFMNDVYQSLPHQLRKLDDARNIFLGPV